MTAQQTLASMYQQREDHWGKQRTAWNFGIELSGPSNKTARQRAILELTGNKVPVSKAGMTVVMEAAKKWLNDNGMQQE